jgi:hypothetical protein
MGDGMYNFLGFKAAVPWDRGLATLASYPRTSRLSESRRHVVIEVVWRRGTAVCRRGLKLPIEQTL